MKKYLITFCFGLLMISILIGGCGGGGSKGSSGSNGSGGNNGNGTNAEYNWLVGTWQGNIPNRPEGEGEGDFEGYTISISIQGSPNKVTIDGYSAYSFSGTVSYNSSQFPFNWSEASFPDMSNSLIWNYFDPKSVTLLIATPGGTLINLYWEAKNSQSTALTSLKCDWQIDVTIEDKSDGNAGMDNYFITLTKV